MSRLGRAIALMPSLKVAHASVLLAVIGEFTYLKNEIGRTLLLGLVCPIICS